MQAMDDHGFLGVYPVKIECDFKWFKVYPYVSIQNRAIDVYDDVNKLWRHKILQT